MTVFGLLKRGGKVSTAIVLNARTETLLPIIEEKVTPDSIVYTDSFRAYNALDVSEFHHMRINHSELFADRGNHINVAGAGVVKHSKNKDNAIALLEFLTEPKAQTLYSSMNYEYPVNLNVSLSAELKSWGEFKEDKLQIEKLAELSPIAQKIIDRVNW